MDMKKTEMLLKGLESQSKYYEHLLEIMKKELELLCSQDKKNSLVSVLAEKLSIMENIQNEDEKIGDIKKDWKDIVASGSPERQQIENVLKHMEDVLKEILDYEEKSRHLFESFKNDFEEVKNKSQALRASRAYQKPAT